MKRDIKTKDFDKFFDFAFDVDFDVIFDVVFCVIFDVFYYIIMLLCCLWCHLWCCLWSHIWWCIDDVFDIIFDVIFDVVFNHVFDVIFEQWVHSKNLGQTDTHTQASTWGCLLSCSATKIFCSWNQSNILLCHTRNINSCINCIISPCLHENTHEHPQPPQPPTIKVNS